jgi:type I restriction enzyme S subunit
MPLGEFAESVDYGVTASSAKQPIGPKLLRITDLQDGAVDWESVPWCACDTRSASDAQLKAGDIVFVRTGAMTGKSFLIREGRTDAVFASYLIFCLRLRQEAKGDSCFLHQLLIYPTKRRDIQKLAGGSAGSMPNISKARLETTAIEVPPHPLAARIRPSSDSGGGAEVLRGRGAGG